MIQGVPRAYFEHANPILSVSDMRRSLRYYTQVLGFANAEWGGDDFTCVSRDGASIYLAAGEQGQPGTWVWVGVSDVAVLHEEYTASGATIIEPPTNYGWAYEMKVQDPDGHVLRFGSEPLNDDARAPVDSSTASSSASATAMNTTEIKSLLERLAQALSTGDLSQAARCFATPSLFLTDEGATVLADVGQTEQFFAQAAEWYRAQGLTATRPELLRVEELTEKIASVHVRWPAFDASGTEQSSERSHYLVQRGEDGRPYIRVALTRTK